MGAVVCGWVCVGGCVGGWSAMSRTCLCLLCANILIFYSWISGGDSGVMLWPVLTPEKKHDDNHERRVTTTAYLTSDLR